MNRRRGYIALALLVTVLATWWASGVDEEDGAASDVQVSKGTSKKTTAKDAARRSSKTAAASQAALLSQLSGTDRLRSAPKLVRDPFAVMSFMPPPPPPPVAIPPKPTAPPLRFQYQGLLHEGDKLAVFLVDGSQLLIAREGETLAGQYRVEKLTENEIVLEYLPLNERQTLNFGRL